MKSFRIENAANYANQINRNRLHLVCEKVERIPTLRLGDPLHHHEMHRIVFHVENILGNGSSNISTDNNNNNDTRNGNNNNNNNDYNNGESKCIADSVVKLSCK